MTAADTAPPVPLPAALVLYAKVLCASSLHTASHRLVAALAHELGFTQASIGLHQNGRTRLLASSDIDVSKLQSESTQRLTGAMDEAIEQGLSLAWPRCAEACAADPIRLEHEALQRHMGGFVATVPLGIGGDIFGAVCVQRSEGPPLNAAELARLEQLLALAAPALRWMHHATQAWHRRAWRELCEACATLRKPERRATRRFLAGAAAAVLLLAIAPLEHTVSGRARIEGAQQRVLVAPADGFVRTAHVRPGDRVKAGDALVDLLDGDLRLERDRWSSQLAQHENAYAAAMAKSDRSATATSLSRIGEAQAQLGLVDEQLTRGRVIAPFDALVIQGDLSQQIGAPVRLGESLLTLASAGQHRVMIEVDEVDIAHVQAGQAGRLALSSLPWASEELVVERITPLAKAVDGRNVFEVQARLLTPSAELRPGLLGRAQLVVGRRPPLWVWTRHALDRLRVAWWSWLG